MARPENTPQEMIDAWLKEGNAITVCPPGERTENIVTNVWRGRGRKKKEEKEVDN